MSKDNPPTRWTCTNCGRRVPAEVAECHCGTTRRAAEALAIQEERKKGASFSIPDLLGQMAVLAAVFYLGLAWREVPTELPPPVGRPLLPSPDPTPPASRPGLRAAAPLAQAPFEPPPRAAPTPTDEIEEAAPPLAIAGPEPSPLPPGPKPEHSELDRKREQAEKRFDLALARLAGEAQALSANAEQFESLCVGGRGEPASCFQLLGLMSASAASLDRGVQEAEEEARHSWVTPGVARDARRKHGLDEATLGGQVSRVKRLEARFHGRS